MRFIGLPLLLSSGDAKGPSASPRGVWCSISRALGAASWHRLREPVDSFVAWEQAGGSPDA